MTAPIQSISAREILDGRLEPTLRVTVETAAGTATADVPAGRSRGRHEAVELRDGGDRYDGRGVRTAVGAVKDRVAPELVGREVTDQQALDATVRGLDGTDRFAELGGNVATGVSLAVLRAGAEATGQPLYRYVGGADACVLPVPFFDVIEGGSLAGGDLPFQEHQLVPVGVDSVREAVRCCAEVYYELGDLLTAEYGPAATNVGDEGGYVPPMDDPRDAFDAVWRAVERRGYEDEFALATDVAAGEFYEDGAYHLPGGTVGREGLCRLYEELAGIYPLVSIEDPLVETDLEGVAALTDRLDLQVIGDDLFASDPDRLRQGIDRGAATALLLKVNQVGTVSAALAAARLAGRNGYGLQVSERSGQTPDTWLADLAVGLNAGQIKTGVSRGERTEQYNRLLEIEHRLGDAAVYGGPALARLGG
jgi:enolase